MKSWTEIQQIVQEATESLEGVTKDVEARKAANRADKEDCAAIYDGLASASSSLDIVLLDIHDGLLGLEE